MAALPSGKRGKSGLHGGTVPGNARRGKGATPNPRESATEIRPPGSAPARVKRRGKSPPRPRRRGRHGKPHREQGQIGTTGPGGSSPRPGASLRPVVRVDRTRSRATAAPDEWPSPRESGGQNPAYRPSAAFTTARRKTAGGLVGPPGRSVPWDMEPVLCTQACKEGVALQAGSIKAQSGAKWKKKSLKWDEVGCIH